jgi:hypothetical protein
VRPRAFKVVEAIGMLRMVGWASERIAPTGRSSSPGRVRVTTHSVKPEG